MKTPKGFYNLVQVSLDTTTPPWALLSFSQLPHREDACSLYSLHLECCTPPFHLANSSSHFTGQLQCLLRAFLLYTVSQQTYHWLIHMCASCPRRLCDIKTRDSDWFLLHIPITQDGNMTSYLGGPTNYTHCYAAPCVIPSLEFGLNLLLAFTNRTWQRIMPLAGLSLKSTQQLPRLHSLEPWTAK